MVRSCLLDRHLSHLAHGWVSTLTSHAAKTTAPSKASGTLPVSRGAASLSGQVKFMYKRMNWKMCHARVQRLILYVVLSAHHDSQWVPRRLKLVVVPRRTRARINGTYIRSTSATIAFSNACSNNPHPCTSKLNTWLYLSDARNI